MKTIIVNDFSLKFTLECGQFFRYERIEDDWYLINIRDKLLKIRQVVDKNQSILEFKGTSGVDKKFVKQLFRLDDNLENIKRHICVDKYVRSAVKKYHGLRLMRQDPWECLISYLCSQMSNIPRIKKNLNDIAKKFGNPIELDGYKRFTFPDPGEIKNLRMIRACKLGYRCDYILEASKTVDEGWLEDIKKVDYKNAKSSLLSLHGVGEKVADCVLLFSLNHLDAFPVDVWMKRVMEELYFGSRNITSKRIREFAEEYFGEYSGYAQQYLFYARRMQDKKK